MRWGGSWIAIAAIRECHGGYLHDLHSDVALFPDDGIGIVCFTNFGCARLAGVINECVFERLKRLEPRCELQMRLARYEHGLDDMRRRRASVPRVEHTKPSHPLDDYPGIYSHHAYGDFEIATDGANLTLARKTLTVPLEHWHYDAWLMRDGGRFPLHTPHPFDSTQRLLFQTNEDGDIASLTLPLEPAVAPIRFERRGN